jgi:hypothetical protein
MFFEEVKRSAASHDEKNIAGSPPARSERWRAKAAGEQELFK